MRTRRNPDAPVSPAADSDSPAIDRIRTKLRTRLDKPTANPKGGSYQFVMIGSGDQLNRSGKRGVTLKPMTNTSRVTERAQTTLPKGVRNALGAGPGTILDWEIHGREAVVRCIDPDEHQDPVVQAFLGFLEGDMAAHPEHISTLPADLIERARELTKDVEIDLDAPLE